MKGEVIAEVKNKICTKCCMEKPIDCFMLERHTHRGRMYRRGVCIECRKLRHKILFGSKYHREWREQHIEQAKESQRKHIAKFQSEHDSQKPERSSRLRHNYKITIDEYEQLAAEQDYVCAICHEKCNTKQTLSVDHCHKTDKVRGLLCRRCNTAIGSMRDLPELLRRAADYLEGNL